jgi:hemerythrin-like domain-containing protein
MAAPAGRTLMERNARTSLSSTVVGFDEPLEMLLACHRRIERQLETLERLQAHVQEHGVDADASLAAQAVLRYFVKAAEHHHEDEEKDLFPLLEIRIPAGEEKARFNALREKLEADHDSVREQWARLRRNLEAIADGIQRSLAAAEVQRFVSAYRAHIAVEEGALQEFFTRWIDDSDRGALSRSMRARRL